jgi:hypothetical protein
MNLPREVLYHRHRLSHQQIDDLLGEKQHDLVLEEKIGQLNQLAQFLEITGALREAGIWFVSYKGPLLSYRIYRDATCRRFKDLDFLVRPGDIRKTIAVLGTFGFVSRSFTWPEPGHREKRLLLFMNQYTLHHPEKDLSIEIHWSLLKYPASRFKKLAATVEENLEQTVFAGQQFNQFSLEFELLHLVIHGGLHTWTRIKWLVDVHEIINRFRIDQKKFDTLVKQLNAERLAGLCNAMLGHYFPESEKLPADYPVPQRLVRYSLYQSARTTDTPVFLPKDLLTYRWFHMAAFTRWHYRLMKLFLMLVFSLQHLKKKFLHHQPVKAAN